MKNYFLILISLIFASCANNQSNCKGSAVGFAPFEGQQVMLGSQETVDVFNQIDAAWAAKDWELLASFVADEASLIFENGKTASNGEEFVAIIKDSYEESVEEGEELAWTTTYAYAVKPTKPEGSDFSNNRRE